MSARSQVWSGVSRVSASRQYSATNKRVHAQSASSLSLRFVSSVRASVARAQAIIAAFAKDPV